MGFYAQGIAAVAIDLSTGIAPWRLPRSHGRFQAGPAPVAEPHSSWHKPGGAFWIGNSRAWASGDAIFTLRFDVAVPDLASFELPYAVERSLKAASLNGKALDFGKPMGPKTLGRSMVIRAPQGTGLFVAGENVLAVTVSHGEGDDSPLGFCATGSLDMAIKNQPPPQPEVCAPCSIAVSSMVWLLQTGRLSSMHRWTDARRKLEAKSLFPFQVIVLDGEARKYQAGGEQPALPGGKSQSHAQARGGW